MIGTILRLLYVTAGLAAALSAFGDDAARAPYSLKCYTSTREIASVVVTPDGTVWAGTRGGVISWSNDGTSHKWTKLDGLPSNEVLEIRQDGDSVIALTPLGAVRMKEGRWTPEPGVKLAARDPGTTAEAVWRGAKCVAGVLGVRVTESSGKTRTVELPKSSGSHVSAMLGRGDKLWAAMFGDGLYEFDGKSWTHIPVELPKEAREVTALAEGNGSLYVGTRRNGLYKISRQTSTHLSVPQEMFDHNTQAIADFRGEVFISTLEDGLVVFGPGGWRRYGAPEISSDSPRQLVEFGGKLYVRHGSGKVDRFDGSRWELDVCKGLPRKQASVISTDGRRLYAGQWGGWSEFDGTTWTHFLKCSEFQGVQITSISGESDRVWVGTQGRGLAEVSREKLTVKWHDERLGMPDDWVKCTARGGDELFAGTFVGGLAHLNGAKWALVPEIAPCEVTALASGAEGTLYIGTRTGIWRRQASGTLEQVLPEVGGEVQALCVVRNELWVGTRTGVYVAPLK